MNELLMQLLMSGNPIIILPSEHLSDEEEGSELFKALADRPKTPAIHPVASPA